MLHRVLLLPADDKDHPKVSPGNSAFTLYVTPSTTCHYSLFADDKDQPKRRRSSGGGGGGGSQKKGRSKGGGKGKGKQKAKSAGTPRVLRWMYEGLFMVTAHKKQVGTGQLLGMVCCLSMGNSWAWYVVYHYCSNKAGGCRATAGCRWQHMGRVGGTWSLHTRRSRCVCGWFDLLHVVTCPVFNLVPFAIGCMGYHL
jgi:hypothetical protein